MTLARLRLICRKFNSRTNLWSLITLRIQKNSGQLHMHQIYTEYCVVSLKNTSYTSASCSEVELIENWTKVIFTLECNMIHWKFCIFFYEFSRNVLLIMILDATEIWFQEDFTQDCSLRKLRTHSHWVKANTKAKKIKEPVKEERKRKKSNIKENFCFRLVWMGPK